MRPETTNTATLLKRVYYVLKRSWSTQYRGENLFVGDVSRAKKFDSIKEVIDFLTSLGAGGTFASEIVRVEETPTPARRELVTTGDLSLLDKGPVVIQNVYGPSDMANNENSLAVSLAYAKVFANISEALMWFRTHPGAGTCRIVPIREIPGDVTITETVLA